MMDVEKRLRDELLRDPKVKLLATAKWSLPIQSFDISFETVKRTKMDILMKMILTAIRTATFSSADEVSKPLVVERLFVQDMMDKMVTAGMIVVQKDFYVLTDAGKRQLDNGVYVQPPEKDEATVYYSPFHGSFLTGDVKESMDELYRYANELRPVASFADEEWRDALEQLGIAYEEGNVQQVVHSITTSMELDRNFAPCIEYHLHHVDNDRLYARVWNTMTEQWDELLENQITEKELSDWRERYLKQ